MKTLALILGLGITACGGSKNGGETVINTDKVVLSENENKSLNLNGIFTSECLLGAVDADFYMRVDIILKNNSEIEERIKLYEDIYCTKIFFTKKHVGIFIILGELSEIEGAVSIDGSTSYVNGMVHDQLGVDNFNEQAAFGYTDWQINIEKDISGKLLSTTSIDKERSIGDKFYSILKIDNDILYIGNFEYKDGKTPENRPDTLDLDVTFKRQ